MEVTDERPIQRSRGRRNIVSVVAIAASMTAATVALVVTRHTAPSTAAPSTQVLTGPVAVSIKDFAFAPAAVTVKVGTVVTWTNADTEAHTVRTTATATLKSGVLDTNGTYTYTFTSPGTYAYHCSIHSEMHAAITVAP